MSDDPEDVVLARAGWPRVADRLLAGIVSDLRGRATSLAGMVQLLSLEDPAAAVSPFLDQEVQRIESSIRLLALLVGDAREGGLEVLDPGEVLPPVLELHQRHRGLETVSLRLDAASPPTVVAHPTLLARTVLIVLAIVGHEALARDRRVEVRAAAGSEGGLVIDVATPGPLSTGADGTGSAWTAPDPEALARLVTRVGAEADSTSGMDGVRYRLRFAPARPRPT